MQPVVRRVKKPVRISGQGVHQQTRSTGVRGRIDMGDHVGQQAPCRPGSYRRAGYEDGRSDIRINVTTGHLYSIRLVGEHEATVDSGRDVVGMSLDGIGVSQQPILVTISIGEGSSQGQTGHDGGRGGAEPPAVRNGVPAAQRKSRGTETEIGEADQR